VGIGYQSQFGGRYWDGFLDEARVLKTVKDESWVKLNYESQREGSKLLEIKPVTTGIRGVTPAMSLRGTTPAGRYDLQGRPAGKALKPGIYLEKRIAADGSVLMAKRVVLR
jgi:hypothetical protein